MGVRLHRCAHSINKFYRYRQPHIHRHTHMHAHAYTYTLNAVVPKAALVVPLGLKVSEFPYKACTGQALGP